MVLVTSPTFSPPCLLIYPLPAAHAEAGRAGLTVHPELAPVSLPGEHQGTAGTAGVVHQADREWSNICGGCQERFLIRLCLL